MTGSVRLSEGTLAHVRTFKGAQCQPLHAPLPGHRRGHKRHQPVSPRSWPQGDRDSFPRQPWQLRAAEPVPCQQPGAGVQLPPELGLSPGQSGNRQISQIRAAARRTPAPRQPPRGHFGTRSHRSVTAAGVPKPRGGVCGGGVTALSRPGYALSAGVGNKVPQPLGQVLEPSA